MQEITDIRPALEQLLGNRHTPESKGLYTTLARYTHRRVERTSSRRYRDVLAPVDREELVGEVLLQLMSGALVRFRGHSVGELLAFVRTISDRLVGHAARKRIRERDTLAGEMGDEVRTWMARPPSPDEDVQFDTECPLSEVDANYLTALFSAGSRAEYAREQGISRAAVTQRLNRIRARIEGMAPSSRAVARIWVEGLVQPEVNAD